MSECGRAQTRERPRPSRERDERATESCMLEVTEATREEGRYGGRRRVEEGGEEGGKKGERKEAEWLSGK